jgi:hypothetical protein
MSQHNCVPFMMQAGTAKIRQRFGGWSFLVVGEKAVEMAGDLKDFLETHHPRTAKSIVAFGDMRTRENYAWLSHGSRDTGIVDVDLLLGEHTLFSGQLPSAYAAVLLGVLPRTSLDRVSDLLRIRYNSCRNSQDQITSAVVSVPDCRAEIDNLVSELVPHSRENVSLSWNGPGISPGVAPARISYVSHFAVGAWLKRYSEKPRAKVSGGVGELSLRSIRKHEAITSVSPCSWTPLIDPFATASGLLTLRRELITGSTPCKCPHPIGDS